MPIWEPTGLRISVLRTKAFFGRGKSALPTAPWPNMPEGGSMELLTPKEASQFLRVSVHTLAKWRSTGQAPDYIKTGKCVRYSKKTLEAFIKAHVVKVAAKSENPTG